MSMPIARVNDIGVGSCSAHDSTKSVVVTIITGASRSRCEGMPIATRISVGVCSCGHAATVISVSSRARAEGSGIHRLNDTGLTGSGSYSMVTAASKSRAGG